jgi:RNA ligase (TIGR02306 family)
VLPEALIDELGLTGRLAGSRRDRVRAVRLRGELSQGIVCSPQALAGVDLRAAAEAGTDFAELLGISKWVPPIPVSMSGDVEDGTELLPWVDIENLKRYPGVFPAGEPVVITEKLHGTCCLLTYRAEDSRVQVSSKGLGAKGLALQPTEGNLYWRTVRAWDVASFAAELADRLGASRVGVFGEVYGAGVQDLGYGASAGAGRPGYAVFDIAAEIDGQVRWLDAPAVVGAALPLVPELFRGPFELTVAQELADGAETVSGSGLHLREGVVIRPQTERWSLELGGRAIAKLVSDAYLTRGGNATEYE